MPRPLRRLGPVFTAILAWVTVLSLAGVVGVVPLGDAGAAPPTVGGTQVFPADNVWNRTVTDLPVHAKSGDYLASIGLTTGLKADFGSGTWDGGPIGIPYITVPGNQPKVAIHYTDYGDESDPGPMPIPPDAPREWGSDHHIIVIDRDNGILYELFNASKNADNSWNASSGAIWSLNANAMRPDGWTSADAAGLPLFPGLARYDEVAAGVIPHALRFTIPRTQKAYVWPASHFASSSTDVNRPPMGMRVRLKANVDISGYPYQTRVILQCLKDYGMILADNGSAIYISGAPDERWNNDNLALLRNVKASDLEVVDASGVMVSPTSTQARPVGSTSPPSAAPSPTATPRPSASPSPSPSPSATPRPSASPSPSPSATPRPSARPSPSPSATPRPSPSPSASPSATPRPSPSPSPTPSPSPKMYALTVGKQGSGSVSPGNGSYAAGTQIRLTATPANGWVFKKWRVDGRDVSGTGPLLITMNKNRSVVAVFTRSWFSQEGVTTAEAGTHHLELAIDGAGSITPSGGDYDVGLTVLLDATPDPGWTFAGWTIDNRVAGYAATLSVTLDGPRSVIAHFAPQPSYGDVGPDHHAYAAIVQLGGAGVIRGYGNGSFGPNDTTLRAQMAALIARAMGWDAEDWGNGFSDRAGTDANLWRNVGTLAHYQVAMGYGDGTFGPHDKVLQLQAISFITRAFVARGWWAAQTDDPELYPSVPASSGARGDLATFAFYTGALPGTTSTAADWPEWSTPATRAWFALALQQAVESYWGGTP